MSTRIIITGSKGRMGQAIVAAAKNVLKVEIVGQIDQGDDLRTVIERGDVVVDFSAHNVTAEIAELCVQHQKALVIGTTGHTELEQSKIKNQKSKIPIVWSANYSTGVNTLFWLTRKAAEILGPNFDL